MHTAQLKDMPLYIFRSSTRCKTPHEPCSKGRRLPTEIEAQEAGNSFCWHLIAEQSRHLSKTSSALGCTTQH